MFHMKQYDWIVWAALFAVGQAAPFLGLGLSDSKYAIFYLVISDFNSLLISLFALSVCPWHRIALKMVAFAFVWWAAVCLIGNVCIEYFDIARPYEMAVLYVIAAAVVGLGCMRFLLFRTPEIGVVDDDHLYLIASNPRTLHGIIAMIITGIGGAFTIWHPGGCELFKYVRDGKISTFENVRQSDCPPHKIVIDMGPATKSRLDYLRSQVGTRWSYFSNCLTKMGVVKYDR